MITILFLPVLLSSSNSRVKKHEEKRQKENTHLEGGDCFLDIYTKGHAFHNHHLIVAENPRCNDNVIILNCMHYYIKELDILHDFSLPCLGGILCQSCCGTEVQVEKTFNCMKLCNTYENNLVYSQGNISPGVIQNSP